MDTQHTHDAAHGHSHGAKHQHGKSHTHGTADAALLNSDRGIWCLKWSFAILLATGLIQVGVVVVSGSVALLADTIHNIGDAVTAIPLGIAFFLSRRKPSGRFTYGLGRFEDLAGLCIIAIILFSAVFAGYESVLRIFNPVKVGNLWAVAVASIIGLAGNEIVARFRIKVGREIGSAALVADGVHARVDGFTSLAVLAGSVGVWLGFPLADPIVGAGISISILFIVWDACKTIIVRLLDGVDPEIIDSIRSAVGHVPENSGSAEVRARWIGHSLHAEISVSVDPDISVERGHEIANRVRHELTHHVKHLDSVTIHIDPETAAGEVYHTCAGMAGQAGLSTKS